MNRQASRQAVKVALGQGARPLGLLTYNKDAAREHASFAYDQGWLAATDRFAISPDLPLVEGRQFRKPPCKDDSVFPFAFADTEPDGWGCRVIARHHAKRRKAAMDAGQAVPRATLTEMDYLLGVDDVRRVGALRLMDEAGNGLRTIDDGGSLTPALVDLGQLIGATRAVEMNRETEADLRYLRGRGTSLGGMRPKCTVMDDDGIQAVASRRDAHPGRGLSRPAGLETHCQIGAGGDVGRRSAGFRTGV